ncbi:MAG: NAD(P)/FAD-dependent oxidoreductase [Polyangiales bacterium]
MTDVHDPASHTRDRVRNAVPDAVDVAVVGAGLGGLTTAALLARRGLKVAVFDGHYVAGGCGTMFSRGSGDRRFVFDIGLHYVGDCGPEGRIPTLLRAAGADRVSFVPLDQDGYDTVALPGLTFRIPKGRELYRERLVAAFPKERAGIDRYVRLLDEVDHMARAMERSKQSAVRMIADALLHGRLVARYQNATIGDFLDSCTRDRDLRAVILGQSGDYGVRPSRASAMLHCGLANHYFAGAYYPKGGGQAIADALADAVEAAGSTVHLRRRVERIVVDGGRATGVRVHAMRGETKEVRAKLVVSNADLRRTFEELLAPGDVAPAWRERVKGFEMGGAIFMTCLGVRGDLRDLGVRASNLWEFDTSDVEGLYDAVERGDLTPRCSYITSASVKDPHTPGHAPPGHMTIEVMTLAPGDARHWGVRDEDARGTAYRRDATYSERKKRVEDALIERAEKRFPGLASRVVFRESSSPVTQTRYTEASGGSGYGLAATPEQFLKNRPGYRSVVPGLYLCGGSTRAGHGIVGAMSSGWHAAWRVAKELDRPLPPLPERE